MEKTTIYFIRHGKIDNPHNVYPGRVIDLHLTEEGKRQIRALAKKIKNSEEKLDAIYASPIARALETVAIIAQEVDGAPIFQEELLTEVDIPALVGHPLTERDAIHMKGIDEYSGEYIAKGNESREEIAERMLRAFKKIHRDNMGKTVIIISHGDPLRFFLFRLANPDKQIPPIGELASSYFPDNGEGWKMVFDKDGRILETEFITREGNIKEKKGVLR